MKNLRFIGDETIDVAFVEKLEKELNVSLPESYRKFITLHNGTSIHPNAFFVEEMIESINNFFDTKNTYHFKEERLPDGIIPFARDAGDNQICFDCRNSESLRILFWDYGDPTVETDNLPVISNSFEELMDSLFEFNEYFCKVKKHQNKTDDSNTAIHNDHLNFICIPIQWRNKTADRNR